MAGALAVGVAVALGGLVAGPETAAAGEWFKPAQQEPYVDLLREPYPALPGHGDTIHATCAPGGDGVVIGVHPWDGVARYFEVWSTAPPAPLLLHSELSADYTGVYPFGWLAVRYFAGGAERFDLVDPDAQEALCRRVAPPSTSTTSPTTSTTSPSTSTTGAPAATVPAPVTAPPSVTVPGPGTTTPPSTSVAPDPAISPADPAEVLEQRVSRGQLPHTGAHTGRLVALAAGLVAAGAAMARRTTRPGDRQLSFEERP